MVAFSSGVILLYWLTVLPPYTWLFVLTFMVGTAAFWGRGSRFSSLCLLLCFGFLGLLWATWHADGRLAERLPQGLEGEQVEVSGHLCSLPQPGSFGSLRFNFCVERWHDASGVPAGTRLPETLRLAWYGRDGKGLPDHRLRLVVVLKRPHGNLNQAGFRYEDWLFRNGFRATGSVKGVAAQQDLACGWHCQYRAWHQSVAGVVEGWFGEAQQFPLVASLLIGNRGHLDNGHWDTLKATGTIHLVAISGLHLGLVAVAAGLLGRRLLLLVPSSWVSVQQGRVLVFALVLLCSLGYALLAGFTVPTRRALVMVVVGGWYLLLAREAGGWKPFVAALFLVLLLDPFAPLDQGFWLSFGAVAVLLLVFAGRMVAPGWLKGLVLAQFAVFAGLWPILSQFGQGQPLAGLLANLVAIPWVSLVVMPVLFVGALLSGVSGGALAGFAMVLMDGALDLLWGWLEWVQVLDLPVPAGGRVVQSGLLALVVVLMIRLPVPGFRPVALAAIALWSLAGLYHRDPVNSSVPVPEIRILDVGQGLSVLVRVDDKVLLYDTGPEVKGVFSAAESVLIPELGARGVRRIDHLVLSHADNDHSGGLTVLLDTFDVVRISSGEAGELTGHAGGMGLVHGCPAMNERWGELELAFWQAPDAKAGNDASCVLRVSHALSDTEIWLTGDISDGVEARMLADPKLEWLGRQPLHRLVLAPHHGSKTSSSERWVEALGPDQVFYTAGYRHRFGHPHPEVTARYRRAGARAFNTACSGQVAITLTPTGPEIEEIRHSAPFWIAGPGQARDQCNIP
jgi:competence protein ComEC